MSAVDPVELAQALIRRPSVTPNDAGAIAILETALRGLGFRCRRMRFGEVENLYARRGDKGPNLCFAGHTDVVPPGDASIWRHDPFAAVIVEGELNGRGSVDMKSALAAVLAAIERVLADAEPPGSISLLITGDEEGDALDGTRRVVEALQADGERVDHCLVGEPTSAERLGDTIKIGRRGSLNAWITVEGVQGHVAYPHRAANPIPVLVRLLDRLQSRPLDQGYPGFQPSNLEFTDLEVGNPAQNVIPALAKARLNIRFNPTHTGADLVRWLEQAGRAAEAGFNGKVEVRTRVSGEAFYTEPDDFVALVADAAKAVTGRAPELSTTGGTSDARFIRALCPVVELGLVGTTMHMTDERAPVRDIQDLSRIYEGVIRAYFERFGGR